ncbi:hypothetical protein [Pandoraea pnomenusa]|uniref:hypothetical protein n=1 Tax=Pandoraea pnomenusa TaxID=93220 RepID=UPI003340AF35
MRDMNVGGGINVGRDFIINDESRNESKLLINCSSDELVLEERHRRSLLSKERSRKNGRLFKILLVATVVFLCCLGYYYWTGHTNLVTFLISGASLAAAVGALKGHERPTEFELRQLAALKEIQYILRERGVR